MKIIENLFHEELKETYPKNEIKNIYSLCLKHLGFSNSEILLKEKKLYCKDIYFLEATLIRLKKQEPIQYILGYTEFRDLNYKLNSDCLIPRPETEELVELILSKLEGNENILDIGTGSGCIPISLKHESPQLNVTAVDISTNALKMAQENAKNNNTSIHFIQDDILNYNYDYPEFEVIISNPPYVLESEKKLMKKNVLNFEPYRALFVKDTDGLLFYRAIAIFSKNHLKKNGNIFFEINESLGIETKKLLEKYEFTKVEIHKDLYGKDRFISATKN